jgi:hypothetical protein
MQHNTCADVAGQPAAATSYSLGWRRRQQRRQGVTQQNSHTQVRCSAAPKETLHSWIGGVAAFHTCAHALWHHHNLARAGCMLCMQRWCDRCSDGVGVDEHRLGYAGEVLCSPRESFLGTMAVRLMYYCSCLVSATCHATLARPRRQPTCATAAVVLMRLLCEGSEFSSLMPAGQTVLLGSAALVRSPLAGARTVICRQHGTA